MKPKKKKKSTPSKSSPASVDLVGIARPEEGVIETTAEVEPTAEGLLGAPEIRKALETEVQEYAKELSARLRIEIEKVKIGPADPRGAKFVFPVKFIIKKPTK
jgi:hypothetical protein